MYKTEVVDNISENLQKELDAFSDNNWGEHVHPGNISIQFFAKPSFAVVAKKGNVLVGVLFVFVRDIIFDTKKYSLGGIGGVVVDKNFRGMDIATTLLIVATEEMKNRRVDMSMLCTDLERLGGLYEKSGFVKLGRNYFFTDKNGGVGIESGGMIKAICSKKAFETILNSELDINVGVSNF